MCDIIRRCRQANRAVAVAESADVKQVKRWLDAGANVVGCGGDLGFMQAGCAAFKTRVEEELGIAF
jgi:2-keto-3-deoxy-L-rhamnonate aldolase RhmA